MIYKIKIIIRFFYFSLLDCVRSFSGDLALSIAEPLGNGHNVKFLMQDRKGKKWVVKVCRNTGGRVPDICEREKTTFLFARLLGLSVVDTFILPSDCFSKLIPADGDFIKNKVVALPYIESKNIKEFVATNNIISRSLFSDSNDVANIFAFYDWIGDEDRGTEDFLVRIRDKKVFLIDHGLSGPGQSKLLRSAHPYPENYNADAIIKKCYPGKDSFFDYIFLTIGINVNNLCNPPIIKLIKNIPNFIIRRYSKNSRILDYEHFALELATRKNNIDRDYKKWLEEAKGKVEEMIENKI
jgi:hypothetical protein